MPDETNAHGPKVVLRTYPVRDRFPHNLRCRFAAYVGGAKFRIGEYIFNRLFDCVRGLLLAEMTQYHRAGPDLSDRIGDSLAGNVGSRSVHRLKHGREFALGIQIGGWRNP